jgi:hypothetical protein
VAFPIPDWALEAVDCCAKKAAMTKVEVQMRPFKFILVAVAQLIFQQPFGAVGSKLKVR